ncbi:MAG: hypothetical protein DBP01_01045, partial [gamma proteobacterium symbiont of Ctena orbiculata]
KAVTPKRTIRAHFIGARREVIPSSIGRIYGSNPVPVNDLTLSCKTGGDHIRDDGDSWFK